MRFRRQEGAVGELLRREGLSSSHLTEWRKQRESGSLAGLAAKKRGPKARSNPLADENARLKRELERMKAELARAPRPTNEAPQALAAVIASSR